MQGLEGDGEGKGGGAGKEFGDLGGNLQAPALSGQEGTIKGLQALVSDRIYNTWLLQRCTRMKGYNAFRSIADTSLGLRVPYTLVADGVTVQPENTLAPRTFTAATTDIITSAGHGMANGNAIQVSSTGTLPAPLAAGTTYFVRDVTTDTFKVALTASGAAVDITGTGTGTHTLQFIDTEVSQTYGVYTPQFKTYRSMQIVTNELLADSTAMEVVAAQMAGAISEKVQGDLLAAVAAGVTSTRHSYDETTDGAATYDMMFRMVTNIGTASGGIPANTTMFNCEQRRRLVFASHPFHLQKFVNQTHGSAANKVIVQAMLADSEHHGIPTPILGLPWYTDDSMNFATSGQAIAADPDILIFDPTQVLLAEKEMVVTLDTQSRMAFNQSIIYTTFRAAGALMHPRAAAGYSLYDRA
jgi:hypothetical protein